MIPSVTINQNNIEGNNNLTLIVSDVLRPYDKELSVGMEKSFLDDASENLIREGKVYQNESVINKVKNYLNTKKVCLIKAPEGRGKTYLSKIIAYYYHHNDEMDVCFIDLKDYHSVTINSIDDKMLEWHKNSSKKYLLVLENVHAYQDVEALKEKIDGWIKSKDNNIWVLLNSRPTYVELDYFSDWEEIVELKPNSEDVNGIINLYSKEIGREPFENEKEKKEFVEIIYPNKEETSGANLRLLKIYLETWQNHPEIQFISGVSKRTIIERFRNKYLAKKSKDEIDALWFISSLFQFDVPMYEFFVQDVGNLVEDGLLRFEENRYHLPHSVDAAFLYKAICSYKHKDPIDQMKIFTERFVKKILESNCPKDFSSDFKLLSSGLFASKDEFKEVGYYLTSEGVAEKIMKQIDPGSVLTFFRPKNHARPDSAALIDYYNKNKGWLKSLFIGLSAVSLSFAQRIFKNNLGYNHFVEDIFEDPKDLDNYLCANHNYLLLTHDRLITPLAKMGKTHTTILTKHYEKNKASLKPSFLGLSTIRLGFLYNVFKSHLNKNIVKDIFGDSKDLNDYLTANNNLILDSLLVNAISKLGDRHRYYIKICYEAIRDRLKPLILRLSPTKLSFLYQTFKSHLNINVVNEIFQDSKDLDDYLKVSNHYKILKEYKLYINIVKLGDTHKAVLIEHYEKNKASLKPLFLGLPPIMLTYIYIAYNNHLNTNIVKDVFNDLEDLESYLKANDLKAFQQDDVLSAIGNLSDAHKQVLDKHNAFDNFFYQTKPTNNGFRVGRNYILKCWSKKLIFDVSHIKSNRFYFDGVSWSDLQKFVFVIKENMTEVNRYQSITMVKSIIDLVLAKDNSLSYASAKDLSYFYYSIASVDETIFQELKDNNSVRTDIEMRLCASFYNADDLYLFDLFFSQSWCKTLLELRIQNADQTQQRIITSWHDDLVEKIKKRGKKIISGSLLDYIHHEDVSI